MYGMETPPSRDSRRRRASSALAGRLSGTLKVDKPAYAVLNTAAWQGDAAPPLDPRLVAPLAEQRTGAGGRPPEPRRRCARA